MPVLDDYVVSPDVSFLDKTRVRAQVLVPVLARTLQFCETDRGTEPL